MLWALFAAMSLIAVVFVILPLARDLPRHMGVALVAVVVIVALTSGLYYREGSPDLPSGASQTPNMEQMVASLSERLQREPDDVNGWKMLGRSYMTLGNHAGAQDAYRRAVQLESAQNAETLVALGVAIVEGNNQQFSAEAITAFENALAIDRNHPEALFWGGIAAFNSGNSILAADRWEMLLATDPPPEVSNILSARIAEWRGEPVPEQTAEAGASVISATVSLSAAARSDLPAEATVFVIARDPQQPSPPIAVARRSLSELPATIELGDRESMIPGRNLSGFAEFEIVARVSVSGNPAAQAGDWFVAEIVRPASSRQVELAINERVQ